MTGDERRICRECGASFTWTEAEGVWLRKRLVKVFAEYEPPSRCQLCQAKAQVAKKSDHRIVDCAVCHQPFACPPWLRREPVRCRSCMEGKRR